MEALLNSDGSLNAALFDQAAIQGLGGANPSQEAMNLLLAFQEHPDSWFRVPEILEKCNDLSGKLFSLNVLDSCTKSRWRILPLEQREGIKKFLINLIIQCSSSDASLKEYSKLLKRLNLSLVQQDWPQNWPNFIGDVVTASKQSESLCSNNMHILKLLSEEVFDFSNTDMTLEKMNEMKNHLNTEFSQIFDLCYYILENSQNGVLLSATLETLSKFLSWIPIGFILETNLIEILALKFFPLSLFQNITLRCMGEIATLKFDGVPKQYEYGMKLQQMFTSLISQTSNLLTSEVNVAAIYNSNQQVQDFLHSLAIFICNYCKNHISTLENGDDVARGSLVAALNFLLRMSFIEEVTVFKICLDYWIFLVTDLYNVSKQFNPALNSDNMVEGYQSAWSTIQGLNAVSNRAAQKHPRLSLFGNLLSQLRMCLIGRMAKPEEVLIVVDEAGDVVRENMRDTDSITLYKSMRECLVYLTHLDPMETQEQIVHKLNLQIDGTEWSWHNLNTLCWAVGSISGAMSVDQEKNFLVCIIRGLLGLVEVKRGKDNKAVIASNIMYVVGQYPRFLRLHWRFLKTVVNKLFEFMHEKHPGVQDMSCDTFLKIAKKCRRKFVLKQDECQEVRPYIEDMLDNLPATINDLEVGQIHAFYEAMGDIIMSQNEPMKRQEWLYRLMELPNQSWTAIMTQANVQVSALQDSKTVKMIISILKTNHRVATAVGHGYTVQLARIYGEMLQVYKVYSEYISAQVASQGPAVTKTVVIKNMRAVKKEVLKLIESVFESAQPTDHDNLIKNILPALVTPVLDDYSQNVPDARDAEVLSLFATIVSKLGNAILDGVPRIVQALFQCTLEMITKNFEDHPDHRVKLFVLLRAINSKCFKAFFLINQDQFQLIMNSVVWAFKHLERNISDTGLSILFELLKNMEHSEVSQQFYQTYFLSLLQDVFVVLTDTLHKPGFKTHSAILAKLFYLVECGAVSVSLWPADQPFGDNRTFLRQHVANMISGGFPNLNDIRLFVEGLFGMNSNLDAFKSHLRDFLIRLKGFSGDTNADLFREENEAQLQAKIEAEKMRVLSVPGLLYQGRSYRNNAEDEEDDE